MASNYKESTLQLLESSAIAGIVTRFLLHPIDTCKVSIQVGRSTESPRGVIGTATHIIRSEGVRGFYRGFLPALTGTIPGVCLYFGSYQFSKSRLEKLTESNGHVINFTAGFVAEMVSCVVWVPTDVVKERAQAGASSVSSVQPAASHIRAIIKHEGIKGLYRGYGATLASFGPFSALYFMFVESLKTSAMTFRSTSELSFPDLVGVCALAGGGAAFCTAPMDLVKVRMQVERASQSTYSGFLSTLSKTFRSEGIRGMFRGGGSRVWFAAPNTAITMAVMESIKYRLA